MPRGAREPTTPLTTAHAYAASTLATLAALVTALPLAPDARPGAAHRPDAPRRVVRRTATGSLSLAGTLLVVIVTRRAAGTCASPTLAPGDGTRRGADDADGTPTDLSGDTSDEGPSGPDTGPDQPPPADPPPEGITECLKDAIMRGVWYGGLELGLSEPDALRRTIANVHALVGNNTALAPWVQPAMLHVTRELGDPFPLGWFIFTCYRDKRDALLDYGATHQAATAYARQTSGRITDGQLFREHDTRMATPAGPYHWDQPPSMTGFFPYIFRLQAYRAAAHNQREDDDSDAHNSSDDSGSHDEPEPETAAKRVRCDDGSADATATCTIQTTSASTPAPPPLPLPTDTPATGCCTPGCARRALFAHGPCCLSCPGAFGRGRQPCHSPSCDAEHATAPPPPQPTPPAPTPMPTPEPAHPQAEPQLQPTQLRPGTSHPSRHEPQTSRAGRRSPGWNQALLIAAAIIAPALREAHTDASRVTSRRIDRRKQLTLLGGALLASAAASYLPAASSSPLPAPRRR